MTFATTVMSMILGFVIGKVVYWLIIRRLIDWLMQRPFTFKTRKNQKLVVAVFEDRVMINRIKAKTITYTDINSTKFYGEDTKVLVYIDDNLKQS